MSRAAETLRWFLIPTMTAQKKLGHYVCVCTSTTPDAWVAEGERLDAVHLRNVGFDVFGNNLKRTLNPFSIMKAILSVRRLLIEHKIDAIICHNPLGAVVGRIAAWLAKTQRIVYFAHGLPCAPAQGAVSWRLKYWVEKLLGRLTHAILVMNDYDEKLCKSRHLIKNTNKVFRIPGMGVNLTQFSLDGAAEAKRAVSEELSIPDHHEIILFFGRVIREKGTFVLVEAAEKICAQRTDICFLLAGGGPSIGELEKVIRANRLQDNIKLLGWRDDIHHLLKSADIFTLPSYYCEGLPVSVLEAMACGKPVVTTRHRGCEDAVVDGETGFLVPVKDSTALAEKITALIDSRKLREEMGLAGRRRVEQHFELEDCTKQIVEALEKAID